MRNRRKPFFSFVKSIVRIFIKKPNIINLNEEEIEAGSIIISNHVGALGPVKHELYLDVPFHFWGTYKMNSGLKQRYKYLSYEYYHLKHKNSLRKAKIKAFFLTPLMGMFYRGMGLILTYPDMRLKETIKTSINFLKNGKSILIFPEDSVDGYFDDVRHYFPGFLILAKEYVRKEKKDIKIYNLLFDKHSNTIVIDKYINYLEYPDRNNYRLQAENLLKRAMELKNEIK